MKRTTIIESIVFLYSILFLYTGISKLMDYDVFKESVADSPVLAPVAGLVAGGLPWLEFAITISLLIPRWRLKGLYAALTLMTGFTGYVIALLIFDPTLPCSCGGILQQLSWPQHMVFNSVFIGLAFWGIVLQKKQKNIQQQQWSMGVQQQDGYRVSNT